MFIFMAIVTFCALLSACDQSIDSKTPEIKNAQTHTRLVETDKKYSEPLFDMTSTPSPIMTTTPPVFPEIDSVPDWFESLQTTNGGCSFPCWGGIFTVGKTSKENTLSWFEANFELYYSEKDEIEQYCYSYEEDTDYWKCVLIRDDVLFAVKSGYQLSLSQLFSQYGPPAEIWTKAVGTKILGDRGFYTIALYYEQKGFIALLYGKTDSGEYLDVCPEGFDNGQIDIILIDPAYAASKSFSEIVYLLNDYISGLSFDVTARFNDVTEYDEEWFYENYMISDNTTCFTIQDTYIYLDESE